MAESNTSKIDIAPLTVIVSEALDPRVRRKLEAEQQADVKTYEELTRTLQTQEDLNKIRQEVEKDDGEDNDPFKTPEASEEETQQADASNPAPVAEPAPPADNQQPPANPPADNQQSAAPPQQSAPVDNAGQQPVAGGEQQQGGDEDLSSAFEDHGTNIPADLIKRIAKEYIRMESADRDELGELEHIKSFVFVDLSENAVTGDTLESVQTLRDPENTIVVISEEKIPDADTTLRARRVAEQLSNRGARVFYNIDEAIDYLNELYDVVSGRKEK